MTSFVNIKAPELLMAARKWMEEIIVDRKAKRALAVKQVRESYPDNFWTRFSAKSVLNFFREHPNDDLSVHEAYALSRLVDPGFGFNLIYACDHINDQWDAANSLIDAASSTFSDGYVLVDAKHLQYLKKHLETQRGVTP